MPAVLKTVEPSGSVGSNPTASATPTPSLKGSSVPEINFMVLSPSDFYNAPCPDGLLMAVAVETRVDVISSNLDDLIKRAQDTISYYVKPREPQEVTIKLGDQRRGQPKYTIRTPKYSALGLPEPPNLGVISRWINGDYLQSFVVNY